MNDKQKLLALITANYKTIVAPQPAYELDEHIPIYNSQMQPIGYFNIRCYEELRKMLQNNPCIHPYNCHYPSCFCRIEKTPSNQ